VVNGMVYGNNTGCQGRMLHKDCGPGETVSGYFRRWRRAGVGEQVRTEWCHRERRGLGRLAEPSAGAIDSQRVQTATHSQGVGFDRHKKLQGRHLGVDTLRLLVAVGVTAAHVDEREGLVTLVNRYFAKGVIRVRKRWGDEGYRAEGLRAWVWGGKRTHTIA
jgi:putative transposase